MDKDLITKRVNISLQNVGAFFITKRHSFFIAKRAVFITLRSRYYKIRCFY